MHYKGNVPRGEGLVKNVLIASGMNTGLSQKFVVGYPCHKKKTDYVELKR